MRPTISLLFAIFSLSLTTLAQAPRHPGIAFYEQANYSKAIDVLTMATKSNEHRKDPEIWNYLALAHLARGNEKPAIKALNRSIDLAPSNVTYRTNLSNAYIRTRELDKAIDAADRALRLDPKNPAAHRARATANYWKHRFDEAEKAANLFLLYDPTNPEPHLLKADILMAKLASTGLVSDGFRGEIAILKSAVDVLREGFSKCSSSCGELSNTLESLSAFHDQLIDESKGILTSKGTDGPGVTPLQVTKQPKALYTDSARSRNIQGGIRALILLGATGRVEHVLVLNKLGYGLEEKVIEAARAIKFEPKKRDGKPIPVAIIREYVFTIY